MRRSSATGAGTFVSCRASVAHRYGAQYRAFDRCRRRALRFVSGHTPRRSGCALRAQDSRPAAHGSGYGAAGLGRHIARRHRRGEPHHLAAFRHDRLAARLAAEDSHGSGRLLLRCAAAYCTRSGSSAHRAAGFLKEAQPTMSTFAPHPRAAPSLQRQSQHLPRRCVGRRRRRHLVKLVATFKEIAVASVYGRSDAMDAFLAAALIPSLLVNLISESMNQALVPTLVRVREQEGRERAQQLLSSSMLWMCLLLGAASAVMALVAHGFFPLIASHFPPAKLRPLHPSLLRPSAHRPHHRHRHQLHGGSEHSRPLRAAGSRAHCDLRLSPCRRAAVRRPLRHLGHGLRHAGRLAAARDHRRLDDGGAGAIASACAGMA